MGLMLNRPTDLEMGDFCESQKLIFRGDKTLKIFQGGPVQTDRAFILHASAHHGPETETILGSTLMSYSVESLRMLVKEPPRRMRVFMGYAGWGPDQLAEELSAGAWLTATPSERLIFDVPHNAVWESALHELGIDSIQLMHSGEIH